MTYMDDNSNESVSPDKPADSRAKNPSNIVERKSADASENTPMQFSGDPIIEAGARVKADQQALLVEMMKSSKPSGDMNQATTETGEGFISMANREKQ